MAPKVNQSLKSRFIPTCHQCGELGHIRPKCRKLHSWKNDTLKNQVDRLVNEVNIITQLVQSSSMEV